MIAVDASSFIAYLNGERTPDTDLVEQVLVDGIVVLPPVVLTEILSYPELPPELAQWLQAMPLLRISNDGWARAGAFRAELLSEGLKARLADTLIATSCIESDVMLITRDADFRHFERFGLRMTGV